MKNERVFFEGLHGLTNRFLATSEIFYPCATMHPPVDPAELADTDLVLADDEQAILDQDLELSNSKQTRIITRVLSPAVRLWLRSQLEQAEDLQLSIEAGDRQLLSGCISQVSVSARKAVYKGLCLSRVRLTGQKIRTNLRQILRGKPLRLLEAFPIAGEVLWHQSDLNSSLQAPLLANGITEFLLILIKEGFDESHELGQRSPRDIKLQIPRIIIEPGFFTLSATLAPSNASPMNLVIRTGFAVENGNQLRLCNPQRLSSLDAKQGTHLNHLDGLAFDLGSTVSLEDLALEAGQMRCRGRVMVTPDDGEE